MKSALCLLFFVALTVVTRCHNYADVFVNGRVYFVDADCYSRMTRVRMVREHPLTIIRHHDFENWPQGITPHTTTPMDWLVAVAELEIANCGAAAAGTLARADTRSCGSAGVTGARGFDDGVFVGLGAAAPRAVCRGDAVARLCEPDSRSRHVAGTAGSSIAFDFSAGCCDRRGCPARARIVAGMEHRGRSGLGTGSVGFALRAARAAGDGCGRSACFLSRDVFLA